MTGQARSTEQQLVPEHCIFDGVIGADELLWIYHELLASSSWTLSRSSKRSNGVVLPFFSFPGLHIETAGDIHIDYLSGYFRSIVFRIRALATKSNGLILPPNIQRIHVGAKSSFSKTEFHVDSNEENVWTILGFLNPVWNAGDGGEFFFDWRRGRHGRSSWPGGLRCGCRRRGGFGRRCGAANWRFGFDEFDLGVGMTQFEQLGLQQRVVAGVVHQAEVIFEFGIEANRENVLGK